MAKIRKSYLGGAASTTTSSAIASSGTTTFNITAYTGWPYGSSPFFVVLEPGAANEEKVLVTRTGATDLVINVYTVPSVAANRGLDGTAAVAHASGSTTYPVFTATEADEANELVSTMTTKGDLLSHGASTFARLGVGTDTYVLKADSTQSTGLVWGQVAAGGIATDAVTTAKIQDSAVTSAKIADGTIVNADINASAAIVDTKLATISTALKVSNSATTAASANTASAIVARDASGNFTAGTVTATTFVGALTGNASTATSATSATTAGTVTTAAQTAITSVGTLTSLTVTGDLTVDTDTLKVDSTNNRVGIGTTSPVTGARLTLIGSDDANMGPNLNIGGSAKTRVGSFFNSAYMAYNSYFSNIGGDAYVYDTNAAVSAISLNDTAIQFMTGTGGTGGTLVSSPEKMRLTTAGNLGIGTTSPATALDVVGTITGNPTAATTSTGATGLGYMGLPQNSTTTGAYGVVAADAGKHIYSTATRTVTLPANGTIAMPIGSTITFVAAAGATVTIAITTDTLILAGTGTTGSRTLAAHGMATCVKITSTSWIISGEGLT